MALIESDLARKRLRYTGFALCVASGISLIALNALGAAYAHTCVSVAAGLLIFGVLLIGLAKPPVARSADYWRRRERAQRRGWMFALGFAAAVGLSFGAWNLFEGYSSQHWPQVSGTITSANVTRQSGKGGPSYRAEVSYRYVVAGAAYHAERISFPEQSFDSPQAAHAFLDRYSVGKTVSVFYSPDNPGRAVLEPGITGETWVAPGIGMIALVVLMVLMFTKRGRKT